MTTSKKDLLKAYEQYSPGVNRGSDSLFWILLVSCGLLMGVTGAYFKTVKPIIETVDQTITRIRTQFIVPEEKKVVKAPPKPKVVEKKEKAQAPIDLTDNPVLGQKEDVKASEPDKANTESVKPVYGLRRVYAVGIGSGGSMGQAVIGKVGNTINKEVDSEVATKTEIKGQVVSVTTVETNPKYINRPKPEYTTEMTAQKIEGVIKVKVLVDIDGKVKEAIPLNDLGFGSAEVAKKACLEALFEPATRNGEPVAVWITIPVRFELLGS